MNFLGKVGLGLALLTATGLTTSAQAGTTPTNFPGTNLTVSEVDSLSSGLYTYTYGVTPTFNTNLITFSFVDPNVTISGVPSGALNFISPAGAGDFITFSLTGGTLLAGTTETVKFTSTDAPGGLLNTATSGNIAGSAGAVVNITAPNPVPEASTTVSFGLLLMLGLGGVVLAARKNKAQASV